MTTNNVARHESRHLRFTPSNIRQKSATTCLSVCRLFRSTYHHTSALASSGIDSCRNHSSDTHPHLCHVPVFHRRICRFIVPLKVDSFHYGFVSINSPILNWGCEGIDMQTHHYETTSSDLAICMISIAMLDPSSEHISLDPYRSQWARANL